MKTTVKYVIPIAVLMLIIASTVLADAPPDPGGGPGGGDGPVGGGSPLSGGLIPFFFMSLIYSIRKIKQSFRK
jgi:hypothetical protein